MGAAREPDQADFDLDRFVNLFDEALTSKDPRVINALRSLMMITTLVRPESGDSGLYNRSHGPLRRLYEDMNHLNRRLTNVEDEVRQSQIERKRKDTWPEQEKYAMEAAKNLAQTMDRDAMRQLSKETAMQVNGGTIKGLLHK
jgi:hypothetical protein